MGGVKGTGLSASRMQHDPAGFHAATTPQACFPDVVPALAARHREPRRSLVRPDIAVRVGLPPEGQQAIALRLDPSCHAGDGNNNAAKANHGELHGTIRAGCSRGAARRPPIAIS